MSLEEKGMYLDLLLYLFTEQRPIKDHKHVARICGIDPRRSARLWTKIGDKFELNQHGSTHLLVSKILNNSGRIRGLDNVADGGGFPAQEKEKEVNKEKIQKKKKEPDEKFETAWMLYPKRAGDNPKNKAQSAWNARIKEGHTAEEITNGIKRYSEFCLKTGKLRTESVKHASTFLGPQKGFCEKWEVPKEKTGRVNNHADINKLFMEAFGRPPPAGKSEEECRQIYAQRVGRLGN